MGNSGGSISLFLIARILTVFQHLKIYISLGHKEPDHSIQSLEYGRFMCCNLSLYSSGALGHCDVPTPVAQNPA